VLICIYKALCFHRLKGGGLFCSPLGEETALDVLHKSAETNSPINIISVIQGCGIKELTVISGLFSEKQLPVHVWQKLIN